MVLGVLLVGCDNRALPTQPGGSANGPQGQRSTGPIAFVSDRDGTQRIYLANEDGSAVTPLVAGGQPAWAKDGRRIAFAAGGGVIHVIGVDGSGDRVIADNGREPAWSPDGRSLVFVSARGGPGLELVNPDGSNRRSLYNSDDGLLDPKWSPDGQRVLFTISNGYADWCFGLWTVNADGSGARQFAGRAVGRPYGSGNDCFSGVETYFSDASQPAWSPDGSEIAFRGDPGSDIEVARADGSGRRLLVAGPAHDPDWTPDGRLIYTKNGNLAGFGPSSRIFISDRGTERQLILEAIAPARPTYGDWSAVWLR